MKQQSRSVRNFGKLFLDLGFGNKLVMSMTSQIRGIVIINFSDGDFKKMASKYLTKYITI